MENDKDELIDKAQPRNRSSLIFVSHDTRDAQVAEAFSRMLSSVSAGVLKSFRSSDKKGNQGIDYGVEWYPEIMKKLDAASDVVCLLTANSLNRPWILYEAGVAKGKLSIPVHGLALGVPLNQASTGPFAQFQNSDDSEESLTQLVMQLVKRIPNSEPDRDVVKAQVVSFKSKIDSLHSSDVSLPAASGPEEVSVAKTFEEIKVMFQDLPARIHNRIDGRRQEFLSGSRITPDLIFRIISSSKDKKFPTPFSLLLLTSTIKDSLPWFYEFALEINKRYDTDPSSCIELFAQMESLIPASYDIFQELKSSERRGRFIQREVLQMMSIMILELRSSI